MKKVLAGLIVAVLMIGASAIFAAEVTQPQLPDDGFYDYGYSTWDCGKMLALYYKVNEEEWRVYILEDKELPLAVRVIKADDSTIIWVDRDRDGHFDEQYSDMGDFVNKYPTPCDAVK